LDGQVRAGLYLGVREQDGRKPRGPVAVFNREPLHILQRALIGVFGQRLVELREQVVSEQSGIGLHRLQDIPPTKAIETGGVFLGELLSFQERNLAIDDTVRECRLGELEGFEFLVIPFLRVPRSNSLARRLLPAMSG